MKSIVYIVPYFGKFPDLFPVWLHSCRNNPTVDWLIFTDDRRQFNYPQNVHVHYISFEELRVKFQSRFDCLINLGRPYKLCDFKITYGDVFHEYIKDYDFWGFCDIDVIWGDIRHFLTEDVLSKYDRIGFQGHSTLIRNTEYYNKLYLHGLKDGTSFYELIQSADSMFADEHYFTVLFAELNIDYYKEFTFANLSPFVYNFRLNYLPAEWKDRNKNFVFEYNKGVLNRVAAVGDKIFRDQYMYVHFLKRDMEVKIDADEENYLIVPNRLIPIETLTVPQIREFNKPHYLRFFVNHFKENAYKLKWNTIVPIFSRKVVGYYKLFFKTGKH